MMVNLSSPLVSVIIPVYNSELYLETCIESVIGQSYSTLEIIIVNDGSTDDSFTIMEKYAKLDERIIIINKRNGGLPSARKSGIDIAKGKYIQHLDSDDVLLPGGVGHLVDKAERFDADIVAAPFYFCTLGKEPERSVSMTFDTLSGMEYFREILQGRGYWSVWANFQKRSLFLDHSIEYVPDISLGEDAILMVQLLSFAQKVVTVDIPILNYYVRPNSLSRSEVVSDKMYKDLRAYPTWIEHYLQRKGVIRELEEDLAHLQLQNLFLAMYWKRYEDAPMDLRKAVNDLKRMPGLRAGLTKRQLKILSVYQLSGWLGDLYLSYYRSRGKI